MSATQQAFYRLAPHLVDFDPSDDGIIEYSGRRFVFFHTAMFAELFERMEDVAGPVIKTRIAKFGEEAGHEIAAKLDSQFRETGLLDALRLLVGSGFDWRSLRHISGTDSRSQIEKIFGLGMYDGWVGDVTIRTYEEGEKAVFDAESTFESDSHGQTGETECRFMTGVVQGMLSYFWDVEDLEATEIRCRCAGDDSCRMTASV